MSRKFARVSGLAVVALLFVLILAAGAPARAQGPRVLYAEVTGQIGRPTVEYVQEAITEARTGGFAALIFRFDTPGGGLEETREISQLMNNAGDLAILGWVGPVGAAAWSAGTILLVSTDLAAMAPGTTIGSVQPVVIGPGSFEPVTDDKILNAVVNLTERQLELHGRNTDLADRFVRENLNLNAEDALAQGAIEIVAASPPDFLAQADGDTTVYKNLTLRLAGAELVTFSPSARVRLLDILSDPLISSLLLILGIYLLIFGLTAPGHGAEIAGIIALLLAIVGLGFSADPVAFLFIILGIILLVVELKTPGFGAFGVGGILMIIIGAVFLAPLRPPRFVVSPDYQIFFLIALITPTATFGGFLLFALYKVLEVRRRKPTIGDIVGDTAVVDDPPKGTERGYVRYHGELWQAISDEELAKGDKVYIRAADGIVLTVSKTAPPPPTPAPLVRRTASLFRRKSDRPPNP